MTIRKSNRAGIRRGLAGILLSLLACVVGIGVAYVLASLLHTQTVLAALSAVGVTVSLSDRLLMSGSDLLGLWRYGLTIALAMALGFLIVSAVSRRVAMPRWLSMGIGGFLAFATMLSSMEALLSFTPIASARSAGGYLLQCCAGSIGGAIAGLNLTIWKNFDSIGTNARTPGRSDDEQR